MPLGLPNRDLPLASEIVRKLKEVVVTRLMFLGFILLLVLGCAGYPDKKVSEKEPPPTETGAPSEEEEKLKLPKDVGPKPVRPTCPPGMTGSC